VTVEMNETHRSQVSRMSYFGPEDFLGVNSIP
jgi:hypothetical protein